jgi:hypothetical protein
MQNKIIFLSGLGLALALSVASAQIPNASRQVDSVQQRRQLESVSSSLAGTNAVPEFYEGETGDVGPQSVLQIKHRRTFVEASADEQYFFSDNVFLADHGKQGADVLVSTVQAALAPTPYAFAGGMLSPRAGYQEQWFNYGLLGSGTVHVYDPSKTPATYYTGLGKFDFNASTVFSDVAWRRQNWIFTFGGDYRRLLDSGNYDEFYHEWVPRWSVGYELSLGKSASLFMAYEGDFRFTGSTPPAAPNPPASPIYPNTFNDRTDQGLVLAGSWRLCRYATLQPFYRFQFAHYTSINRDDFLNSFGLALYCPITRQITLRTFVSYDMANTDGFYVQNYRSLNAGGGLNLTVRF